MKSTGSIRSADAILKGNVSSAHVTCLLAFVLMWPVFVRAQGDTPNAIAPETISRARQSTGNFGHPDRLHYLIAPDDVLNVYILDVPELSRDYRVSPDGSITLPLLSKSITAEGLTPDQLSAVIADRLKGAGLVESPHVLVTVKSSTVHSVAIMGAVKKPQIYPVFGPTTLLDVLAQGEGLAPDAGNTAIITRGEMAMRGSGLASNATDAELLALADATVKVSLEKLLETGDPSLNLTIYPGDKVTVERAGIVYVVGAVNRPGGFTLESERENMTVLKAIALGEGLKSTARRKKAMIIRQDSEVPGSRQQIAVNLAQILAGHAPDRKLRPNDILFVPDSASKIALYRGAEAAVQITTGVIVYRR